MKHVFTTIITLYFILAAATPSLALDAAPASGVSASAVAAAGNVQKNMGQACYMPYSVKLDHIVTGCEIPGYHMNYDEAKELHIFMILLPEGADSMKHTPHYFAADTLDFGGVTLKELLEADIKGIQSHRPGTKIVKTLEHKLPMEGSGACLGLTLVYPKKFAHFPYETYFICETGSEHYAIMLSLSATTKRDMDAAMPAFLKWMDVPQAVRDYEIAESK